MKVALVLLVLGTTVFSCSTSRSAADKSKEPEVKKEQKTNTPVRKEAETM